MTSAKLAKSSVTNAAIANGVIGAGKLGSNAVTTPKIANGAVTLAKLGNEVAPLLGTPTVNPVLAPGNSTANCPGVAGGSRQTPNASPGNLCVYVSAQSGEAGPLEIENPSRLGFGLRANAKAAGAYDTTGFWAVTAP